MAIHRFTRALALGAGGLAAALGAAGAHAAASLYEITSLNGTLPQYVTTGDAVTINIKAATEGTLVTRNVALDGVPIRGDREARIASVGCFAFTDDINDWLRNVEGVRYKLHDGSS